MHIILYYDAHVYIHIKITQQTAYAMYVYKPAFLIKSFISFEIRPCHVVSHKIRLIHTVSNNFVIIELLVVMEIVFLTLTEIVNKQKTFACNKKQKPIVNVSITYFQMHPCAVVLALIWMPAEVRYIFV